MKNESREFLIDYIKKHTYSDVLDYDMFKIFKAYSSFELQSDDEIEQVIDEFSEFWKNNAHLVQCEMENGQSKLQESIKYELNSLKHTIKMARTASQKQFADMVTYLSPGQSSHILDVGAGKYPYSSILLAKKIDNVASMDNGFYISDPALKSMNVETQFGYFNAESKIDNFDFVVGRFPCSAIEHIVRKCSQENTAYFIQLCGCYAPNNDDSSPFYWKKWRPILSEIDPNIKFFHSYAYNIDATNEQVEKILRGLILTRYSDTPPPQPLFIPKFKTRIETPKIKLDEDEIQL